MTVKRKQSSIKVAADEKKPLPDKEELIDKIIDKGGKTTAESQQPHEQEKVLTYSLRIPMPLMQKIRAQCSQRVGKVSVNTWILEVLDREFSE